MNNIKTAIKALKKIKTQETKNETFKIGDTLIYITKKNGKYPPNDTSVNWEENEIFKVRQVLIDEKNIDGTLYWKNDNSIGTYHEHVKLIKRKT